MKMRKWMASILCLVMVLGVFAVTGNAAVREEANPQLSGNFLELIPEESQGRWDYITNGVMYLDSEAFVRDYQMPAIPEANYNEGFTGPSAKETSTYKVSYSTSEGNYTGIPKGVNSEELLKVRISYDRETRSYNVRVIPVENPTVEVFTNVQVEVKFVKTIGNANYSSTVNVTGGSFSLMNRRYTSKDMFKDASGNWRISAGTKYPVVDESVFNKAYGSKLIVEYPDYTVTFNKVKEQDIALNLAASVQGVRTVSTNDNAVIRTITFHSIYVKDAVDISFKLNADAQNYKGTIMYLYALDANGKAVVNTGKKVQVDNNGVAAVQIAANSRLGTYGLFSKSQG